jgi:hypothetical protein
VSRARRRRDPVVKIDLFVKAKWLVARGMPPGYVAGKLGVSRATVGYWVKLMDHDSTFKQLRRRVLRLPEHLRDQLVTDLVDARRAA